MSEDAILASLGDAAAFEHLVNYEIVSGPDNCLVSEKVFSGDPTATHSDALIRALSLESSYESSWVWSPGMEHPPEAPEAICFSGLGITNLHNIHDRLRPDGLIRKDKTEILFPINKSATGEWTLCLRSNDIRSNVLGLMLLPGLRRANLDNRDLEKIVNKHLSQDRDVFEFQYELIDSGLEAFASQ